MWRYQNEDNYYIVRANALENNVVLYQVPGRDATPDLALKGEAAAPYGRPAPVPAGQWNGRGRVHFEVNESYEGGHDIRPARARASGPRPTPSRTSTISR